MVWGCPLPGIVCSLFFLGSRFPVLMGSRVPGFHCFWVPEFMGPPAPGTL